MDKNLSGAFHALVPNKAGEDLATVTADSPNLRRDKHSG